MSLHRETLVELMALVDGELEGDAKSRAEALVDSSAEARAVVSELRRSRLGSWLRPSFDGRADAARADDIVNGVMTRIGAPPVGARPRAQSRVVRPAAWWGAGGVVLAAAAGMALYFRTPPAIQGEDARTSASGSGSVQELPPPTERLASGVEVDEIDAPTRGVSVFEIPVGGAAAAAGGSAHPSSVVVWIDDSPGAR